MDSNRTSSGKHWNKVVYHEQVGSIQSIQYFDQLTIRVSSTNDSCATLLTIQIKISRSEESLWWLVISPHVG